MENLIRDWREKRGLSRRELAEKVGTGESQIVKLERGERRLTQHWMERLAKALDVQPVDLIMARANDLPPPQPKEPVKAKKKGDLVEVGGEELALIPVYDLGLSCGPGAWVENDGEPMYHQPYRHQWLRSVTNAPLDALLIARASGDSMDPTIHNGDQVLIDTTRNRPTKDGIYGLRWADDLLVKRISVDPRNGMLEISSDNPRYRSFSEVNPEEIHVIGRVIWIGRSV